MSASPERKLRDLAGIGRAMEKDFVLLGIHTVAQLARRSPEKLFDELCAKTGQRQDPCVLDTFRCAVAQARNPQLPAEQRQWWWWSKARKEGRC